VNQEDIIRMAREAGFETAQIDLVRRFAAALGDFAALVAAHEREDCAKVCESNVQTWSYPGSITRDECAAAIRARSHPAA